MKRIALLLIAVLALFACGHEYTYKGPLTADVWIDAMDDISMPDVDAGCGLWLPVDVHCQHAPSKNKATVWVTVDTAECERLMDGAFVLGDTSEATYVITMHSLCIDLVSGDHRERQRIRLALSHELGHSWGIWEHVPLTCSKTDPERVANGMALTSSTGKTICGPAIMNPMQDTDLTAITRQDIEVFGVRDVENTTLRNHAPTSTTAL